MLTRSATAVTGAVLVATAACGGTASRPVARPSERPPAGSAPPAPAATPVPSPPSSGPAGLNDEQRVGQLFMAYVYGSGPETATAAQRQANIALYGEPTPAQVVRRWHLGGVILIDHNDLDPDRPDLSTGNVGSADQVTALTAGLQAVARADTGQPLLIATDEEGGRVQRLRAALPAMPAQGALGGTSTAQIRCRYRQLGQELRRLGVNQDFAPVADVVTTSGGVIGDRSFGSDPATDADDVVAATAGLQDAGVLATLKHWPGHGSTSTDSHAALAVVRRDAASWRGTDVPPFAAAVPTAAAVMVGHLALPSIDPSGQPATLSSRLVDGELRGRLGFQGLVVTDSLWMQPMRAAGPPADTARRALEAGSDLLLESPDLPAAYTALLAGVRRDEQLATTVAAAARRVLAAKARVDRVAAPAAC